jgi:hypothetical protein
MLASLLNQTHVLFQGNLMRIYLLPIFFCFCIGLLGCGSSGLPTTEIKGKVTFDGAGIPDGVVYFDSANKSAPSYSTQIKEGEYSSQMAKGTYTVRITAMKSGPYPAGVVGANGEKEGPVQYIPAKYNEATTKSIDVTGAGPQEIDFPLTSK